MKPERQKGLALVLVLVLVALLVTIVGEFVYTVYTGTAQLKAWQQVEAMGVLATTAFESGKDIFAQKVSSFSYTYPAELSIPIVLDEETATVTIRDLQSKINLNGLVFQNGTDNERLMKVSRRLLESLNLSTETLDLIADWIDPDQESRLAGSEEGAKNGPLVVFDELNYIKGIKKDQIDRMRDFFTVYPDRTGLSEKLNINTVKKEILMAMAEGVTEQMAEEAIRQRGEEPFQRCSDIKRIPGFEPVYPEFSALCTVKSSFYEIEAKAQKGEISSLIDAVVRLDGTSARVLLFREF